MKLHIETANGQWAISKEFETLKDADYAISILTDYRPSIEFSVVDEMGSVISTVQDAEFTYFDWRHYC